MAKRRGPKPRPGLPKCSWGHTGSHVKRAGFYGKGVKRQLYFCTPVLTKDDPHRFSADILPRHPTAAGVCEECDRAFPATDGPPQPLYYSYAVRDIAWALVQVGSGRSYRAIARRLRRRVDRHSSSKSAGGTGYSRDARLVCDWIEAYAPTILHKLALQTQPTTILVDHLIFRTKRLNKKQQPKSGGGDAFFVLAVGGQNKGWPLQMLRMEASRKRTVRDWVRLLEKVPAPPAPKRLICDEEAGIVKAAQQLWPNIEVTISPWHLQHRAGEYLRDAKRHAVNHPLRVALNTAFKTPTQWTHFLTLVTKARAIGTKKQKEAINGLKKWTLDHNQLVLTQFQQKGWPVSTGGLEAQLRTVKAMLFDRRDAFTNKKRTDLMLGLVTLNLNESDDQRRYATLIREYLEANGGSPAIVRGTICDPKGKPTSLRG